MYACTGRAGGVISALGDNFGRLMQMQMHRLDCWVLFLDYCLSRVGGVLWLQLDVGFGFSTIAVSLLNPGLVTY